MKLAVPIVIILSSAGCSVGLAFTQSTENKSSAPVKLLSSSGQEDRSRAPVPSSLSPPTAFETGSRADQLLENVVAQLPREPLTITGALKVRKRRGIVIRELKFEMFINWGIEPSLARYTIRDASGRNLEQMTVIRSKGRSPGFAYASGSPLLPADPPDLFESIQGTDISWMDLTLSFLWWKGGTVVGTDEIRGRQCYIVEVTAPSRESAADLNDADKRYSKARLWIDKKLHMLLQVQGYDSSGEVIRRLWIKSFKKIDDRWMIKDMEIQVFPGVHRTRLRVSEVSTNTQL